MMRAIEADPATRMREAFAPMQPPLVSLIVTNYNYERFIGTCLASLAAQTYPAIEVIVVDDVSTDGSVAAIEDFIASNPAAREFQLLALETNGGQMNAFMEGFARSRGSFVTFVDADDVLLPDFVETHVKAHLNARYPAALTCSNEIVIDREDRVLASTIEFWHRPSASGRPRGVPVRADILEGWQGDWEFDRSATCHQAEAPLVFVEPEDNRLGKWIWSTTSGGMFRRGILEAIFNPEIRWIRICADYYLFQFAHLLGGSLLIPTPHGCYRRHGNNNFAIDSSTGRCTGAGISATAPPNASLNRAMADTLYREMDKFIALIGATQVMFIIARLFPLARLPRATRRFAKERTLKSTAFMLAVVAIRKARATAQALAMRLRYV